MIDGYSFKQETDGEFEEPGGPFRIILLFACRPDEPPQQPLMQALQPRLGRVEAQGSVLWFPDVPAEFEDGAAPCGLEVIGVRAFNRAEIGPLAESQMREAFDYKDDLLDSACWAVEYRDLRAEGLAAADRACFDVRILKALLEVNSNCLCAYVPSCGRLVRPQDALETEDEGPAAFVKYAVNARFFAVDARRDSVVDTVGLNVLGVPDLQYHFHDLDPKAVASHALGFSLFLLLNDCPVEDGDAVAGFSEYSSSTDEAEWTLQYEESLIQPRRSVLDVHCGPHASGERD